MLLLAGCAFDSKLNPVPEEPFSDGKPDDTGVTDTDETGTDDTATPDDTGPDDTDPVEEPCVSPGSVLAIDAGGTASPWATLLLPDVDGGGRPDLLLETWEGDARGIALVRGEDVATGNLTPTTWLPALSRTAQAAYVVGAAGDLDGDGRSEVAVGEGGERTSFLNIWDVTTNEAPLATIAFDRRASATWPAPAEEPGPDLDGDGIPEVVVTTGAQDPGDQRAFVFDGARLGTGGAFGEEDAALTLTTTEYAYERPATAGDLDGDGTKDLLVELLWRTGEQQTLFVPSELAARGGTLDYADLDVLVSHEARDAGSIFFVDLDADGQAELFSPDGSNLDRMLGFAGTDVARAAQAGGTLEAGEAWVTVTSEPRAYLGAHVTPVTDGDCEPGLAFSSHLVGDVRLVSNAALLAGGTVATYGAPALEGSSWYGYVTAGGEDLDGDGTLDLVVTDLGGVGSLYLAPWDALP